MTSTNNTCSIICLVLLIAWIYHLVIHVRCQHALYNVRNEVLYEERENDRLYNEYTTVVQRQLALRRLAAHNVLENQDAEERVRNNIDRINEEIPQKFYDILKTSNGRR